MERLHQSLAGTRESFTQCSRPTRCLIVAVGTLLLAWLTFELSRPHEAAYCQLFLGPTATLHDSELEQIEIAFGKSGLTDFEIRDGRIWVPSESKSEYLIALDREDAVPARWKPETESEAGIFLPPSERKRRERERKRNQVEQMVGRLPYVEEAWLEVGQSPGKNAFDTPEVTAAIGVQPSNDQSLAAEQIQTIQQMVANAVGGIEGEKVVVIDYGPGRAYAPTTESHRNLLLAERQSHYEKAIARALQAFPGVEISVVYELPPPSRQTKRHPVTRFASRSHNAQGIPAPSEALEQTAGANGQVSLDDLLPSTQLPSSTSEVAEAAPHDWAGEQVLVTVRLPRNLVQQHQPGQSRTVRGGVPADLESLQREIIERVTPHLPIASFEKANQHPVRIEWLDTNPEATATSWWTGWEAAARRYGSSIAVLAIGLLWIGTIAVPGLTGRKRLAGREQDGSSPLTPPPQEDMERYREAEGKLSQLVDADPEAAAQVIRSWIRDAA